MGNWGVDKNQSSSKNFHEYVNSDISVSDLEAVDLECRSLVVNGRNDNDQETNDEKYELTGLKSGVEKGIVTDDVICKSLESLNF